MLVGGGELHDRFESLVRTNMPLRREASSASPGSRRRWSTARRSSRRCCPALERSAPGPCDGRPQRSVRPARAAPGVRADRARVAGRRRSICTAALARALLPLQRRRGLGAVADALGIEVETAHRALADAETCGRVLCALFPRLCANAGDDRARRWRCWRPRRRARTRGNAGRPRPGATRSGRPELDFARAAGGPGRVPVPRSGAAGCCTSASRSRSAAGRARTSRPRAPPAAWTAHATIVDYRTTRSELGALVLENRLIKELQAAGQHAPDSQRRAARLHPLPARHPYPILEVVARAGRRPRASRRSAARAAAGAGAGRAARLAVRAAPLRPARCRAASIRRPTVRWAAACRPASAIWTRTSTAAGWTRRCALFVAGRPRRRAAARARRRGRCAPRRQQQRYERAECAAPARAAAGDDPGPARRRARGHPFAAAAAARAAPDRRRRATASGWSAAGCVDWGPLGDARDECAQRTGAGAGPRERAARRAGRARASRARSTRCGSSRRWLASHPRHAASCRCAAARRAPRWRGSSPGLQPSERQLDDLGRRCRRRRP